MSAKDKPSVLCQSAIRCHAWSAARDQVALVPNNDTVVIYSVTGDQPAQWQPMHTLAAHDQKVLGVDWDPKSNRLLSCSEDRTAYVWEFENGKWDPKVVHLGSNINRAVLCCSWAPNGQKFAVGTGSRLACVCYFEPGQNWWVAQCIKHHSSSVTCVAWHPRSPGLLATGSADQNVRLFAALLKGEEGECFGKFGTALVQLPTRAWVKDLKWSPNGALLAFTCHDSTLSVADVADNYAVQTLKTRLLPFTSIVFPSDNVIIAACSDCFLYAFTRQGTTWALSGKLKVTHGVQKFTSNVTIAMQRFQSEAAMGQAMAVDKLESRHQNVVSELRVLQDGPEWKVSSSGYDGQVYLWGPDDVEDLAA